MKLKYSPKSTNIIDMRDWHPTEQTVVDLMKRNKKDMNQHVMTARKDNRLGVRDKVNWIKKYNKEVK